MTFLAGAFRVLEDAAEPLTSEEILQAMLDGGQLRTRGKTPGQTLRARLYEHLRQNPDGPLQQSFSPGP
jgi:hypothetical protein